MFCDSHIPTYGFFPLRDTVYSLRRKKQMAFNAASVMEKQPASPVSPLAPFRLKAEGSDKEEERSSASYQAGVGL